MTTPGIEFCICTFNRVEYLQKCIDALQPQIIAGKSRIMIVDNNSTDGTKEFVESRYEAESRIAYIHELKQGLSNARNTGWKKSDLEWIFYIDDDCIPPEGIVNEALQLVSSYHDFDAYGGPIHPLYAGDKPEWLPEGFGSVIMHVDDVTEMETGYARGCNFLVKKKVLESLGGFDPDLGPIGKKLMYADEIELQSRMRQAGYKIAYAPALKMNHFIRTDKISLGWILHSEYAKRRDKMAFAPITITEGSINMLRTVVSRFLWMPVFITRAVTKKNYKWRNVLLDTF
ncbi:MAG TPA: glycosyltransferase, partial [Saprospiraceae bacterium]|nr:glycosyltransferase [Saprospiraceae bacterium]